jgi:oligoendopeptidase F
MFDELPTTSNPAMGWTSDDFQRYFDALNDRPLNAATVSAWLMDWSNLMRIAQEVETRLEVATTLNTADEAADERYGNFLDTVRPVLEAGTNQLSKRLIDSGLEPDGMQIPMRDMRAQIEIFREENLPLQAEESKLELDYSKITGAQTIEWDGEEVTLTALSPVLYETDRTRRESAWRRSMERRLQDRDALGALWTRLLDLRRKKAANACFPDYIAYRWKELKRFDYTPQDSAAFRDAIEEVVVPVATRVYDRHRQGLGLPTLRPWDEVVDPEGRDSLKPFDSALTFETTTQRIFDQVDPALGEHFQVMRASKLLDLENRKNKAPGGYCTALTQARVPFIFMNAVGLHDDVQTLLHEGGHAFHVFESRGLTYFFQEEPPIEFAEVASMAMELLSAPYLKASEGGFYNEGDASRALVEHLEGIIKFWPYMAVVDGFQHWAYTHPEANDPAACDAAWSALWERFMPGLDYSGLDEVKATGWQRKEHIFSVPFYYIEYGLAQLGAVQVWANARSDQAAAVRQYRAALALGGTASLPDLFAAVGARFAFDAGTLRQAVTLVEDAIEANLNH